jgi:hypothetical protein
MGFQGLAGLKIVRVFVIIGIEFLNCVRCVKQRPIDSRHGEIQKLNAALQWLADGSG